jgi:hypothetical protein
MFTGKSIGKRLLGGPRRRWEAHIRMDLKEIGINIVLNRLKIGIIRESL